VDVVPQIYWFLTEFLGAGAGENVYEEGITLKIQIPDDAPYSNDLSFYRRHSDGSIEYVGGTPDSSGGSRYVELNNFTTPRTRTTNDPAGYSALDTFALFIARDTIPPKIEPLGTGVEFFGADNSIRLVLNISDNTVNLDARFKVFTFNTNGTEKKLWDSITTALQPPAGPNTTVRCTVTLAAIPKDSISLALNNGLFASIVVNDFFTKYFYSSPSVSYDSISVTFRELNKGWSIVSVAADFAGPAAENFFEGLQDFQLRGPGTSTYDRERLRLYQLKADSFLEYNPFSPFPEAKAGQSYLILTQLDEDNFVTFGGKNAVSKPLKSEQGYVVANGTDSPKWNLISVPFKGSVTKGAIVRASKWGKLTPTGVPPRPLDSLIFVLEGGQFLLKENNFSLQAPTGYGKGFLVYLYPEDTLIIPVESDSILLPPATAKRLAKKGVHWQAALTLLEDVRGKRVVVDGFNRFGVHGYPNSYIPDLVFPGTTIRSGFRQNGKLMTFSTLKNDGPGKKWTYEVQNAGLNGKSLILKIESFTGIPESHWIYLQDKKGLFSTDLRGTKGEYAFFLPSQTDQSFEILVGDPSYVKARIFSRTPETFALLQNMPNPFNPATTLRFQVPDFMKGKDLSKTRMVLDVFTVRGQKVRRLVQKIASPGHHKVIWNGTDRQGKAVGSGLFVYRFSVWDIKGNIKFTKTRMMLMVK